MTPDVVALAAVLVAPALTVLGLLAVVALVVVALSDALASG